MRLTDKELERIESKKRKALERLAKDCDNTPLDIFRDDSKLENRIVISFIDDRKETAVMFSCN